jgi:hypothetical protein
MMFSRRLMTVEEERMLKPANPRIPDEKRKPI